MPKPKLSFNEVGSSSFGAGEFTPAGFAAAFRRFGAEMHKPVINAMRRGLYQVQKFAMLEARRHGLVRKIWGDDHGKKSNLTTFIRRTRVKQDGKVYRGGIELRGIPALQEKGGRTKGHWIGKTADQAGKVLSSGRGGIFAATAPIWHTGGVVRQFQFLDGAMRQGAPIVQAEMDKEIQKLLVAHGVA